MAAQDNNSAAAAVSGFFKAIGGFFTDFGTAVIRIRLQTGNGLNLISMLLFDLVGHIGSTPILPYNSIVNWYTCILVPNYAGLTLVIQSQCQQIAC